MKTGMKAPIDKPPVKDVTPPDKVPLLCWNRRRAWAVGGLVLLLIAIPVQLVIQSGLFAFLVSLPGMLTAIWLSLKTFERGINQQPGDCRYARQCDCLLVILMMLLFILLHRIESVNL